MATKTNIIGFKDLRLNADKYISAIARGKSFTVVRRSNLFSTLLLWMNGEMREMGNVS